MQVLNPVLVMILIPLFETLVYPAVSAITKLELTPLRKMSSGMMLAGVSFLYVACIQVKPPLQILDLSLPSLMARAIPEI